MALICNLTASFKFQRQGQTMIWFFRAQQASKVIQVSKIRPDYDMVFQGSTGNFGERVGKCNGPVAFINFDISDEVYRVIILF